MSQSTNFTLILNTTEARQNLQPVELHAIFQQMREGFFVGEVMRDKDGRVYDFIFVEMNEAFEQQTGISAAKAIGASALNIVENIRPDTIAIYEKVVDTGEPAHFERSFPERDDRCYEARACRVGRDRFSLLFLDITARKALEETAKANAAKFRLFAQTLPNHVWTSSADGRLDWFNDRVYGFSGLTEGELDGAKWTQLVHPDDLPSAATGWAAALQSGDAYEIEFRLRRADGVFRWFLARAIPLRDASGRVYRWIGTNTDIEDQKATVAALAELNATLEERVSDRTRELLEREAQLHQAQKMEAVGQLTGGIAHDFNNMLAVVNSAITIVRRQLAKGNTDVGAMLDAAVDGVERAAGLTARLLAFARQEPLQPAIVDVNALLSGMTDLVQRSLGGAIRFETAMAAELPPVCVDASQLENAILNLAINARDAMPDGGSLTLATDIEIFDKSFVVDTAGIGAGEYVRIAVSDTGAGMTPEVMARAFEPLFTTKPVGKGTGLGLSQVFSFAKQSGGYVKIDSQVGCGTTIQIFLPRHVEG